METLAFAIISISKDGNISTFSPEMSGGTTKNRNQFVIGNVLNIKNFDSLLDDAGFKKQYQAISTGVKNCARECSYFDLCGGGSPSNKFYEKGSFAVTETVFCVLTKKTIIDLMIEKLSHMDHISGSSQDQLSSRELLETV